VILQRKAKNGHPIEVGVVPASGLDGQPYRVETGADNYFVALNEEVWLYMVKGSMHWMDQAQTTFMFECWMAGLVDFLIDMDDEAL
jgi:hypothetical protein